MLYYIVWIIWKRFPHVYCYCYFSQIILWIIQNFRLPCRRRLPAKDPRIKILQLNAKGGASIARNMAINKARGRYIAFLDGDDLWLPSKLRKQIDFMIKNDYAFTYTNYYVAKGEFNSRKDEISNLEIKTCPPEITYNNLLNKNHFPILICLD